jgi:hypothetical protein
MEKKTDWAVLDTVQWRSRPGCYYDQGRNVPRSEGRWTHSQDSSKMLRKGAVMVFPSTAPAFSAAVLMRDPIFLSQSASLKSTWRARGDAITNETNSQLPLFLASSWRLTRSWEGRDTRVAFIGPKAIITCTPTIS